MRRFFSFFLICLFCLGLTACGPRDHSVLAGAAVGAGVGTVGAAVVDGHPLVGAMLGAGAGALVGAAIDSHHDHRYRHRPHRHPRPHRGWR